jgi:hypothetical protein
MSNASLVAVATAAGAFRGGVETKATTVSREFASQRGHRYLRPKVGAAEVFVGRKDCALRFCVALLARKTGARSSAVGASGRGKGKR